MKNQEQLYVPLSITSFIVFDYEVRFLVKYPEEIFGSISSGLLAPSLSREYSFCTTLETVLN
ncbi:hypothetical protein [Umezakia ovalisporum]|uniref:Uncharacterized protein n=1 Tax=Umezakia ovalisporum FSS-43 TaxID=2740520 RepID=A0ABT6JZ23_9CYAN|nr:hypothetical protein [Umezakia ovalisporum]MBI1243164.1 hypothetical protein [Nostoc sp. RI_552]MDH6055381.1 hypothetical protein [Umezakia ovalisporum FSS-43]MDH6068028.1 hypothetical protein [Umezakia ovalisporum APH033B]MDH6069951.1 hypothetical protein [Umezakia ovalisporum CobakiLakeA]MDH6073006.1 hypothetical protein [Umezakia ovalisporum CS-1034]